MNLEVKKKILERDYAERMATFKKETGVTLDVNDIHTFVKYDMWVKKISRRARNSMSLISDIIFTLDPLYLKETVILDSGLCIDSMNREIYFPSDGTDADGKLFSIDKYRVNTGLEDFLELNNWESELEEAYKKAKELRDEREYADLVKQYNAQQ